MDGIDSGPSGRYDPYPDGASVENWVIFSIRGREFNPDVISMNLGIEPDRIIYPKDNSGEALWQLRSTLHATHSLEAHFWEILKRILPARKSLMRYTRDAELIFTCTLRTDRRKEQHFELSPRLLILVGHLGASLRFVLRSREEGF